MGRHSDYTIMMPSQTVGAGCFTIMTAVIHFAYHITRWLFNTASTDGPTYPSRVKHIVMLKYVSISSMRKRNCYSLVPRTSHPSICRLQFLTRGKAW